VGPDNHITTAVRYISRHSIALIIAHWIYCGSENANKELKEHLGHSRMYSPYSRALTGRDDNIIRVLRVSSHFVKGSTVISGTLLETSLHNPLPYVALSYRWGEDKPDIPIAIAGGSVNVTSNGHAALLELSKDGQYSYIWIDAICIDQSNNEEKGVQVAMMSEVYSKAERVVVWLGKAYDGSREALEWCEYVSRRNGGWVVAKLPYRMNLLDSRIRGQVVEMCSGWARSCTFRVTYHSFLHSTVRLYG